MRLELNFEINLLFDFFLDRKPHCSFAKREACTFKMFNKIMTWNNMPSMTRSFSAVDFEHDLHGMYEKCWDSSVKKSNSMDFSLLTKNQKSHPAKEHKECEAKVDEGMTFMDPLDHFILHSPILRSYKSVPLLVPVFPDTRKSQSCKSLDEDYFTESELDFSESSLSLPSSISSLNLFKVNRKDIFNESSDGLTESVPFAHSLSSSVLSSSSSSFSSFSGEDFKMLFGDDSCGSSEFVDDTLSSCVTSSRKSSYTGEEFKMLFENCSYSSHFENLDCKSVSSSLSSELPPPPGKLRRFSNFENLNDAPGDSGYEMDAGLCVISNESLSSSGEFAEDDHFLDIALSSIDLSTSNGDMSQYIFSDEKSCKRILERESSSILYEDLYLGKLFREDNQRKRHPIVDDDLNLDILFQQKQRSCFIKRVKKSISNAFKKLICM